MTAQVAVIQMVSSAHVATNLDQARRLLAKAAQAGARLAVLPENVACMTPDMAQLHIIAEQEGDGPIQQALAAMARRHRLWLVAGTIPLLAADGRLTNTCLVFDDTGQRVARYDKIHLFDVDVPGGEVHRESAYFAPGREVVVLDTPVGRLGLAVCFDLRFPELFRAMVAQGAELIALPAAFTYATGRVHWEVLLRARAIENLCFVLASAQGGLHFPGRMTFGHSQIIGPWGEVLACHAQGPGLALAPLDRNAQRELRRRFPVLALAHRVL
ncbi:MAG: carbon-nitrogen hydrolase family protein [Gammaproteobacteria bacterium]|nr:carbon-nitrogen hydrolase family protein [Gammaproteobacteria bacterium]